jgi:hypothetical protein
MYRAQFWELVTSFVFIPPLPPVVVTRHRPMSEERRGRGQDKNFDGKRDEGRRRGRNLAGTKNEDEYEKNVKFPIMPWIMDKRKKIKLYSPAFFPVLKQVEFHFDFRDKFINNIVAQLVEHSLQ